MHRKLAEARTVLTGASSGIGRALAASLAKAGAHLLITARRQRRLEELAASIRQEGGECEILPGDITDGFHRRALGQWVDQHWGCLDLLVNNAGVGAMGPFMAANEQRLRRIMEVNFMAPAELMREMFPRLQSGRQPLVANISSVLGHRAVPNKSEYCAAKFALHGLSDALRAEWQSAGVDVLLISPSSTSSEFFDNLLEKQVDGPKVQAGFMTPDRVASIALSAIRRGRHEVILSAGGKSLVWLDRLLPALADRLVARYG